MKKYRIVLSLILVLFESLGLNAQVVLKIVDDESNEPVSFVVLSVKEQDFMYKADMDGLINVKIDENLEYTFSRLGYKTLQIAGSLLTNSNIVKMESFPVELSPITVTADAAWRDLNRAIDNTFNSIPKSPFFLKCYQNDKVLVANSTVVNARAIYSTKILKVFDKGKGCNATSRLKGLKVESFNKFNADLIKKFSDYNIPFVNDFLVGEKQKYDNDVSFYCIDVNDSILIIGYSPKLKFIPKSYIITSGRFVIDKKDWKLLRIDSDINPRMLKYQNEKVMDDPKKELLYQKLIRSIYFSKKGFPRVLEEKLEYTNKNDKTKSTWANITSYVYKEIKEKEFKAVPMKKPESKSIIYQKPFFTPNFDSEFAEQFQ